MEPLDAADATGSLLRIRGIYKSFPGVQALQDVDLEVARGEVHALVGENGAGKTTLMHVLAGVHRPDGGRVDFDGREDVTIANERAAQTLGIAIVYQERSLFDPLSIAENVFAARQPVKGWHIDRRRLFAETAALLRQVGLCVDPRTPLARLSPAQQQLVEVAKALSLRTSMIIFDEPTAALTERETKKLFEIIGQLRAKGIGVIYISHRLEEVFQIADRVTVLKDGRVQGTQYVSDTSPARLVSLMVGRDMAPGDGARVPLSDDRPVALDVRNLFDRASSQGGAGLLRGISFRARSGEIVVLAGLAGAGRTELGLSLFGARSYASGDVHLHGRPVRFHSPREAIAGGIGYLPEDRKEAGLFLQMSIAANVVAASLGRLGSWWMRDRQAGRTATRFMSELNVAARHVGQSLVHLSGGNQQKVLLAKWLLVAPQVLIVDEPTRGVDVGAKAEIHRLLYRLSRQGTAVIVISSDLMEVLAVADRIVVLHEGVVTGELSRNEATEERVIQLASQGPPA